MPASQQVFPAVHALIEYKNKFLLIKQVVLNKYTFWDLPGGKVKFGENPYDTLHREVKEEVGLTIDILTPLGMWQFLRLNDGHQVVSTVFHCRAHHAKVTLAGNPTLETIGAAWWVTAQEYLDQLPGASDPSLQELLVSLFTKKVSVKEN